jgi:protein-S-isoprenylcysteine O-methyltransferase Ste14
MSRVNTAELTMAKPERSPGADLEHGHPTLKRGLAMSKERDKWKIYRQIAGNIVLGLLYVLFAAGMTRNVILTHRVSGLLLLLYQLLVALFAFIRNFTKRVSVSTFEWFAAMMGTYLPLLLRATAHGRDNPFLVGIQVTGVLVTMTGLLSLNKSFGIVPADRGIKTGGLYCIIRHPLYAGYLASIGAFTAMNPSGANIGIYLWFAAFEIARLFLEETFLSADAEYSAYMRRVRWRLIPFVF